MRVLACSSPMWRILSLLPVGYIYGQEEKLRNQNSKWHLQTGGSPTFHLEPLSYKYFLSWLRRGSKPKVSSGVDLYSSGPQTSICKGTIQRACGESQGVGAGISVQCANLRKPWCTRPLDHMWWAPLLSSLVSMSVWHTPLAMYTSALSPWG